MWACKEAQWYYELSSSSLPADFMNTPNNWLVYLAVIYKQTVRYIAWKRITQIGLVTDQESDAPLPWIRLPPEPVLKQRQKKSMPEFVLVMTRGPEHISEHLKNNLSGMAMGLDQHFAGCRFCLTRSYADELSTFFFFSLLEKVTVVRHFLL